MYIKARLLPFHALMERRGPACPRPRLGVSCDRACRWRCLSKGINRVAAFARCPVSRTGLAAGGIFWFQGSLVPAMLRRMSGPVFYDIIGDVHGRFDKLEALMTDLGYRRKGKGFLPPAGRRALFLGDLIDPKPGHRLPGGVRATLRAVKSMCDRGNALCVMGNHELYAILFHTLGPKGGPLRSHSGKNIAMHQGTLDDFPDHESPQSEWRTRWLPWIKRLPFYLDLGGIRAVHATWHPESVALLKGRSLANRKFFTAVSDKRHPLRAAVEILVKGISVELPESAVAGKRAGALRRGIRARWWELPCCGTNACSHASPPGLARARDPLSAETFAQIPGYPHDAPPVFFGHYPKPASAPLQPERHNVACLDHRAAKNGPLVAYRWMGETHIDPRHYASHRPAMG